MNETSHTLVLTVSVDRECLRGSVTAEGGRRREFAGRLGLIGAIDDLLTPSDGDGTAPAPAAPSPEEPS